MACGDPLQQETVGDWRDGQRQHGDRDQQRGARLAYAKLRSQDRQQGLRCVQRGHDQDGAVLDDEQMGGWQIDKTPGAVSVNATV